MDRSKDSAECERAQWITLEHAVELVRSVSPGMLSRRDLRQKLAQLAVDETLRCRDIRTGEEKVPYIPVDEHGHSLPKLVPEVEIELRSLHQYLLQLRREKSWPLSASDILNLGKEGTDPAEALELRLIATGAPVEHETSTAQAAIDRPRGGSPGKPFKVEMAFLVGFGITELKSPDLASVKELILDIADAREGWDLHADTAHGWAREFMEWYNQRNRET